MTRVEDLDQMMHFGAWVERQRIMKLLKAELEGCDCGETLQHLEALINGDEE